MPAAPAKPTTLPVFPLPDYHLFPGTAAPLQIFETRYRQMMSDLMDGPGRLVLVPIAEDGPRGETGPVLPGLGTLAEVMQHEQLADGRWLTLVLGLDRVAVTEVPSDRLYRKVQAEVLPETEPDAAAGARLRERLLAALRERADGDWEAPAGTPLGRLADVLLQALGLDTERAAAVYRERDPLARAALALVWHEAEKAGREDAGEA